MKRLSSCVAIFVLAFLALLLVNGAVYSIRSTASDPARPWYGFTRTVTITVGSSTDPLTPALNSRWQLETLNQVVPNDVYAVPLPSDAYDIHVQINDGVYTVNPGPIVVITTTKPWFYLDYRTNQQVRLVGSQMLIAQTANNSQEFRYISTLIFTAPYQYVGASGYSPISVTSSTLHWDNISLPDASQHYRFSASTWLASSALTDAAKPDLRILTATLQAALNQIQVSAVIQNHGAMTTAAPSYLNLYDYIAPSSPPTNPFDTRNSGCQLYPLTQCPGLTPNPLPLLGPGEIITVTGGYTLAPRTGIHDIYFLVDGLGGSLGQNWESNENNNSIWAGSVFNSAVFMPILRRG